MIDLIRSQISGKAIPIVGNDIDTDRIVPARFLKEISFENMGNYAFYDERFEENGSKKEHPFNQEAYSGATILLVGKNFGCGSSREHAPQALMRYGIQAIIGESYSEIFAGNCKAIGIPAVYASAHDIYTLQNLTQSEPKTVLTVDLEALEVTTANGTLPISIDETRRQAFLTGTWDARTVLLAQHEAIQEKSNSLPY